PCGWLGVPARLGETEALTVTFGDVGASATAAATPATARVARNATTPSLRMIVGPPCEIGAVAAAGHTLAESGQTCTAMFLSAEHALGEESGRLCESGTRASILAARRAGRARHPA